MKQMTASMSDSLNNLLNWFDQEALLLNAALRRSGFYFHCSHEKIGSFYLIFEPCLAQLTTIIRVNFNFVQLVNLSLN